MMTRAHFSIDEANDFQYFLLRLSLLPRTSCKFCMASSSCGLGTSQSTSQQRMQNSRRVSTWSWTKSLCVITSWRRSTDIPRAAKERKLCMSSDSNTPLQSWSMSRKSRSKYTRRSAIPSSPKAWTAVAGEARSSGTGAKSGTVLPALPPLGANGRSNDGSAAETGSAQGAKDSTWDMSCWATGVNLSSASGCARRTAHPGGQAPVNDVALTPLADERASSSPC
mmetsp:Transcript_43125/g.86396  ORF Transcript_43125/g.86396 Transcript_43125/m.86396 type:complete len:224 (+) Transcript_43125:649-1320(+)